ncbi:MAG: DNA translocase FtsK 4TM domain-containing protein [Lentisphaeria bacterium]|nr:DNA translocase FtsK 4TM domain-containing protein [Lentisphaeria bacterium]
MPEKESAFKIRYIFYFAGILLVFLAVLSYSPLDAALMSGGSDGVVKNWIGRLGAYFGLAAFHLFGVATYFIPFLMLLRLVRSFVPEPGRFSVYFGGCASVMMGLVLLFGLSPEVFAPLCDRLGLGRMQVPQLALSGGAIGQILVSPACPLYDIPPGIMRNFIGAIGSMVIGWAFLMGGLIVIYISDWHRFVMDHLFLAPRLPRQKVKKPAVHADVEEDDDEEESSGRSPARNRLAALLKKVENEETEEVELFAEEEEEEEKPVKPALRQKPSPAPELEEDFDEDDPDEMEEEEEEAIPPKLPAESKKTPVRTNEVGRTIVQKGDRDADTLSEYTLPPISMLSKGSEASGESPEAIKNATLILQRTLDSFNIPGEVVGYISGPRITRYEISLAEGVNVKKVAQIESNIAMNLEASSIRVLAPIPGRNVVGVEVPNTRSEAVFMRSAMETDAWKNGKAAIPVVLGKNVASNPIIIDLAKAPHLLIAGSTGSGKSVCMNTLIMSLLFKFSPDELRLIMVDPKRVEFEDYRKLPHLITPVINDAKKVPIALRWAVTEMENRYKILARAGVKKLAEFNALSKNGEVLRDSEGQIIEDNYGTPITKMPILIVIIDELAELRMQDSWKDSETYIARIAQLGRAAGVHIVVATQRPSTNIITGVIKANLPTRIAFRVLQLVDSRVILDLPGAENLLGLGDMLALLPGAFGLERIQGALVDDKDIKAIVKFVSDQRPQNFDDTVIAEGEEIDDDKSDPPPRKGGAGAADEDDIFDDMDYAQIAPLVKKYLRPGDDDTMRRALEVVILDRKASTSYIQRRLKIGYNRAAELVDTMEERGILGPPSGSGNKREILIFDGLELNEQ